MCIFFYIYLILFYKNVTYIFNEITNYNRKRYRFLKIKSKKHNFMHSTAIIRTIVRRCIFSCFVRKRKSFIDVKFELANQFERFWFNFDRFGDRSIDPSCIRSFNFKFLFSALERSLKFILHIIKLSKTKKKRKMYSRQ